MSTNKNTESGLSPDPAALVAAERVTAAAYAKTVADEGGVHFARVKLIGTATADGQTVRGIAAAIGFEGAKLAYPTASERDLRALGEHAPFRVVKSTVQNYATAGKLLRDAGVSVTSSTANAAFKLACRNGATTEIADLAFRVAKLPADKRADALVEGVTKALRKLATARKAAVKSASTPAANRENPGTKGGTPVTTEAPMGTPVGTPASADVLLTELEAVTVELAGKMAELTDEDTARIRAAFEFLWAAAEALV